MSSKQKRPPRQAALGKAQVSIDSGSNYNNIPAELKELPQWVVAGKNKIPIFGRSWCRPPELRLGDSV